MSVTPAMVTTDGLELLATEITYGSGPCLAVCDRNCGKAWGIGGRPTAERPDDDPDNVVWLADGELGQAPADPGCYEDGQGKPWQPKVHNKWCVRACERANVIDPGKAIACDDWSQRIYNQPWKHGLKANPSLVAGTLYRPGNPGGDRFDGSNGGHKGG